MKKIVYISIVVVALIVLGISGYLLFKNSKVTVLFNTNSEIKLENVELEKGESIKLPVLERDGYSFLGWYTDNEIIDDNYKFDKKTFLNAKWQKKELKKTYKVTFSTCTSTNIPSQIVEEGGYAIKPKDPEYDDHSFCGWEYGSTKFDFKTPITHDIWLDACWKNNNGGGRTFGCRQGRSEGEGAANSQAAKPLIYLYPEKEMDVEVKLGNISDVTTIYPRYNNGWNVKAYPNGKLIDKNTKRELYGLYWEGKNYQAKNISEGFVVKGEDTIEFLEEKLAILGLNEREAEEFIIYWLPQMEHNNYNYIRFAGNDELDKYMPLEVNPKPDTVIRIMMEFMPLDEKMEIKEQKLKKQYRHGFTVIEWGGTVINQNKIR